MIEGTLKLAGPDHPSESGLTAEPAAGVTAKKVLSPEELEERRLLRRMQLMMNLVIQTIAQDGSLSLDEASQMVADARNAALTMFPGKELAFDLIWQPRLQRTMRERFRSIN